MKLSQAVSLFAASVLAHSSGEPHHHDHHHNHPHPDLGAVCGPGARPLDGEGGCSSEPELLAVADQKELFAEKPGDGESWKCPNGTDCDYAHKHKWTYSEPCYRGNITAQDYCVFTDNEFAEGRGTSFVMTRRRADYIATTPAFTDPQDIPGLNQDLKRTMAPKYDKKEFPGKGWGLVANQFIARGEMIMANTASLMIDYRVFDELTRDQYVKLQTFAVDYLPEKHREAVLALSTHGQTFDSHEALVEKIGETNAFDIDPDDGDEIQDHGFFVVFPEIARFNHDCRPNADYYFDHAALTQFIHATRDIQPGEELTLSYINPVMLRVARMAKLARNWGFQCACSHCTQPRPRTDASDARIRQIKELKQHLRNWKAESPASPQMAELMISLYEQERLGGSMYSAYSFAALEYNAIGDPWTATKYARLAIDHGIPMVGERHSDVTEMKSLADDPWAHWSWTLRSKKRSGWGREIDDEDDDE
ncbi:hypothetical protein QBC34DRAFT_309963 [Podospora aff. communis PSN243]|uniref:SET domain-containing protein n=1 Tax=Podospora aff. communis PSN243 TaxID=3040156 RepID=A0AAV9G6H2_9PEZI|nr:hypothetical protein QBC34DRAFT_309963 [Podospora aff. communis PSN243]